MDDRLQKALDHANYKATIAQQKENLKLRFATARLHAHNGGMFTVTPDLISFVDFLVRRGETEAILTDDKNNPVQVTGLADFLDDIYSVYVEATNEYYSDYERMRKARTVKAAVGV